MPKDRGRIAERILNITLEIIYLLTGEDSIVMKKLGSSPHVSKESCRTQISSTEPPPHSLIHERNNDQKILELTNKIIQLLTGEVPIRCEDVTVYFSMEEWEYLEGHKDLYKDVMMETHQTLSSPGKTTCGTLDGKRDEELPSPVTVSCFIGEDETYGEAKYHRVNKQRPKQKQSMRSVHKELVSFENRHFLDNNVYTIAEHERTKCPSIIIKKEPTSCQEGNHLDHYTGTEYAQIKEELALSDEENLTNTNNYPPTECTEMEYIDNRVKMESASFETTKPTAKHMHTPTEYAYSHTSEAGKGSGSALEIIKNLLMNCRDGGVRFNPKSTYPAQITAYATEKTHHCAECQQSFTNAVDLVKHQTLHRGKSFACSQCGKEFSHKSEFLRHQTIHTGEKPFTCAECGRCFTSRGNLVRHKKRHTGEKPFTCPVCGKCFIDYSTLVRHQKIHAGFPPFSCSECGKCFTSKSNLVTHQRIHTGESLFSCSVCGKCFTRAGHLVRHQRIHTGDKPFACPICGKRFASSPRLSVHQRIHTGEKPFSCSQCGNRFTDYSSLVRHHRLHTGDKPFSCSECGKCFANKSNLIKHQRVHTGERPFSCSVCGKCFSEKSTLLKHQMIHTGEKPFSCADCGKCFTSKSNLVAHQRIHSGKKPFQCSDCWKCFSDKSVLIKHQRVHTGEKPFMFRMREVFHQQIESCDASSNSHGREAIFVFGMWEEFQGEVNFDETPEDSHCKRHSDSHCERHRRRTLTRKHLSRATTI
ncbi:LOW QUALITY PROTEIN: uncharacterized protein RCH25_008754 [Pelodytes ibericus]